VEGWRSREGSTSKEAVVLPVDVLDELDVTLRLVRDWALSAEEWTAVRQALADLRQGLRAGDAGAVERCMIVIDELAPTRLGSLGVVETDEAQPAPPDILQLVVELQSASESHRRPAGSGP
jgi:hypothetical protein